MCVSVVPTVLVANKADLEIGRAVTAEEGQRMAKDLRFVCMWSFHSIVFVSLYEYKSFSFVSCQRNSSACVCVCVGVVSGSCQWPKPFQLWRQQCFNSSGGFDHTSHSLWYTHTHTHTQIHTCPRNNLCVDLIFEAVIDLLSAKHKGKGGARR